MRQRSGSGRGRSGSDSSRGLGVSLGPVQPALDSSPVSSKRNHRGDRTGRTVTLRHKRGSPMNLRAFLPISMERDEVMWMSARKGGIDDDTNQREEKVHCKWEGI